MACINRRAFVGGGLAASSLLHGSAFAQSGGGNAGRSVAAIAEKFLSDHGLPGLSIAVSLSGRTVLAQRFGIANPATGDKVTIESQFRIASLSKPFTAATAFALIEKGKLKLSDRVFGARGILGNDYGTQPYGRFIEDITVEHLLTHSAGGWPNRSEEHTSELQSH